MKLLYTTRNRVTNMLTSVWHKTDMTRYEVIFSVSNQLAVSQPTGLQTLACRPVG